MNKKTFPIYSFLQKIILTPKCAFFAEILLVHFAQNPRNHLHHCHPAWKLLFLQMIHTRPINSITGLLDSLGSYPVYAYGRRVDLKGFSKPAKRENPSHRAEPVSTRSLNSVVFISEVLPRPNSNHIMVCIWKESFTKLRFSILWSNFQTFG